MVEGWEERNDMISTLEEAQKSYQPISFKLPFSKDSLPNRLMVSSELFGHALKEEATYAVMTTIVAKENVRCTYIMSRVMVCVLHTCNYCNFISSCFLYNYDYRYCCFIYSLQ